MNLWLAVAGIATIVLIVFSPTLLGLIAQRAKWPEDDYVGKPVAELEQALSKKGEFLMQVDKSTIYSMTGRSLKQNEYALLFKKGKDYPWFYLGSASNIGYVIVDRSRGDIVGEVIHRRTIDSM